jgi:hypothetical protein
MVVLTTHAWTIGTKGRVNGPSIHTSYFLTPNNQSFIVHANAFAGTWANGICQQGTTLYDLGNENLATGDIIDIDAFQLKAIMGGGYACLTIYYYSKQLVIETMQLNWDGFNYTMSLPAQSEITIL